MTLKINGKYVCIDCEVELDEEKNYCEECEDFHVRLTDLWTW